MHVCVHWAGEYARLDGMTAAAVVRQRRPDDNHRTLNALVHAGNVGLGRECFAGSVYRRREIFRICVGSYVMRMTACTHMDYIVCGALDGEWYGGEFCPHRKLKAGGALCARGSFAHAQSHRQVCVRTKHHAGPCARSPLRVRVRVRMCSKVKPPKNCT